MIKMKKIVLANLFAVCLTTSGQQIKHPTNHYRYGDMQERGNRTYLHQGNGIVRIIGSENAQELISYDMPET